MKYISALLLDIWDGYVTFVVSIIGIGVLTAFIGDLASHLGCTVGLKDSVTAIAFVALGTSVPGTVLLQQILRYTLLHFLQCRYYSL